MLPQFSAANGSAKEGIIWDEHGKYM